jgi:aminomethyltransferase
LKAFELKDKGIARHGYDIVNAQGEKIGVVTSGTNSPLTKKSIGMGYINADYAELGTEIFIQIRNKNISAQIVKTPFFQL